MVRTPYSARTLSGALAALSAVRDRKAASLLLPLPFAKGFEPRLNSRGPSREPSAQRQALRSQRSPAQQIANPTALALIAALHFGQNFSPPGPFAASGGHCEPTATDSNTTGIWRLTGTGRSSPRRCRCCCCGRSSGWTSTCHTRRSPSVHNCRRRGAGSPVTALRLGAIAVDFEAEGETVKTLGVPDDWQLLTPAF